MGPGTDISNKFPSDREAAGVAHTLRTTEARLEQEEAGVPGLSGRERSVSGKLAEEACSVDTNPWRDTTSPCGPLTALTQDSHSL